jgi:hypothetical protein
MGYNTFVFCKASIEVKVPPPERRGASWPQFGEASSALLVEEGLLSTRTPIEGINLKDSSSFKRDLGRN